MSKTTISEYQFLKQFSTEQRRSLSLKNTAGPKVDIARIAEAKTLTRTNQGSSITVAGYRNAARTSAVRPIRLCNPASYPSKCGSIPCTR